MSEEKGCSSESCNKSSCAGCGQAREEQQVKKPVNHIKNVIGIVSGKGGVGKSFVTGQLAVMLSRRGYDVGILDADITGPSIPRMFGIHEKAKGSLSGIMPAETSENIKVMSTNLLLENEEEPVIWRGPILAGIVKQFWSDVNWGELDYLLIDMPPGTGDVPLTVFQSIPVNGIIVVTTPQDLVSMIVKKACHMAEQMHIPVLGLVENMSYVVCPDCGKKIYLYGESQAEEVAASLGTRLLARLPIDPDAASLVNAGQFSKLEVPALDDAADHIEKKFFDTI